MSEQPSRRNVYLTDENVEGPAIELARAKYGLEIVRDVDLDIPCSSGVKYDECLFHYAVEHRYVLVTGNYKDFDYQFYEYVETHDDHPGLILIPRHHRRSHYLIADWLALCADEDMTNRVLWVE
jgi:hypothetical protein